MYDFCGNVYRHPEGLLCVNVALSDQEIGWALDVVGRVWFCAGVTRDNPTGDGKWWQVCFLLI